MSSGSSSSKKDSNDGAGCVALCYDRFSEKPKLSNVELVLGNHVRAALRLTAATFNCQQCRFKGSKRFKMPSVAKDKEKWQPREKLKDKVELPSDWEEIAKRAPKDDVWFRKYYMTPSYSFSEAIELHRQLASVEMQDNVDGLVFIDAQLDHTTKKKMMNRCTTLALNPCHPPLLLGLIENPGEREGTLPNLLRLLFVFILTAKGFPVDCRGPSTKFHGSVSGTVLLPFNYDTRIQSRVLAIAKTEEDKEKAASAGAVFVGGLDIVKKIEKGDIKPDDYDYVVMSVDMLVEAALIRRQLKDRFPVKKKGNLGSDISSMVKLFANGKPYESFKASDAVGRLTVPIGKLDMPIEELLENAKTVVETVSAQKPVGLGPPIFNKISITCPPSKESFLINDSAVMSDAGSVGKQAAADDDDDDIDEVTETDDVIDVDDKKAAAN